MSILDALPGNIAVFDKKGDIVLVNRSWIKYGVENGGNPELTGVGNNYLTVCSDTRYGLELTERAKLVSGIKGVVDGENKKFEHEYEYSFPKEKRWSMTVVPLTDKRDHFLSGHWDVTDFKTIPTTLKTSEAQLRVLFDRAADNILIHPIDENGLPGNYSDVNSSACQTLGYDREQLLNMGPQDTTVIEDPGFIAETSAKIVKHGHAFFEAYGKHKNGHKIPFEINAHLITIGDQRFVMAISRDVTEMKRLDRDREKLIEDLQAAFAKIKTLSGMLPICSYCKKIRNDRGYWNQIETYIHEQTGAQFSHGICPDCAEKLFSKWADWKDDES